MGLVIFFGIAIISATMWHHFIPRYWQASLGATVTTVALFQVAAYLDLGHFDKFVLIAVATSFIMALAASLLIGLPIRARRKRQGVESNAL
jgi:hypothetical protein